MHQYRWQTAGPTPTNDPSGSLQWIYHPPVETQRPPPMYLTTYMMVCSRYPWPCHNWHAFILKAQNCTAKPCCPVCSLTQDLHPSKGTCHRTKARHGLTHPIGHSTHHRSTQAQGTDNHHYLHSTHEMTSSRPTLTTLKALVSSLEPTTSP